MADSLEELKRKIKSADDLRSVVHTLKVLSAISVVEYERAVESLEAYYQSLNLALYLYLHHQENLLWRNYRDTGQGTCMLIFGSDQGLAGQFDEIIASVASEYLKQITGARHIWAIGERIQMKLEDMKLKVDECFNLPHTVPGITTFIGDILLKIDLLRDTKRFSHFLIFYNRLKPHKGFETVNQYLLPLDDTWRSSFERQKWPGKNLPEIIGENPDTFEALIREYLFISLFRSCAESLASEHSYRLAAMQRAEKNIDERSHNLQSNYDRLRQNKIDEELFDVMEGFEVLKKNFQE